MMSTPSAKKVIAAFAQIMREKLEEGETVDVPSLGTFSVEHRPSEMAEGQDGETRMIPPRDVVKFEPDQ